MKKMIRVVLLASGIVAVLSAALGILDTAHAQARANEAWAQAQGVLGDENNDSVLFDATGWDGSTLSITISNGGPAECGSAIDSLIYDHDARRELLKHHFRAVECGSVKDPL
jgi:hypothetical protein